MRFVNQGEVGFGHFSLIHWRQRLIYHIIMPAEELMQ
jgi:hypothetical protein